MGNKEEKYYNYIVDDLFNKSDPKIDDTSYVGEVLLINIGFMQPSKVNGHFNYGFLNDTNYGWFRYYCKQTYGAKESDMKVIWRLYIDKLHNFFIKYGRER